MVNIKIYKNSDGETFVDEQIFNLIMERMRKLILDRLTAETELDEVALADVEKRERGLVNFVDSYFAMRRGVKEFLDVDKEKE